MKRLFDCSAVSLLILLVSCDVSDSNYNPNLGISASYQTADRWTHSSVPISIKNQIGINEIDLQKQRGNLYWYNTLINSADLEIGNQNFENEIEVLNLVYDPSVRGCYNNNDNYKKSDSSWGGITSSLMFNDKIKSEIENQFLSMWIHLEGDYSKINLNIDLGEISEDINSDGKLNSEDKNYNEIFNNGEDTGLDGLKNENENGFDASNQDPSNDNYSEAVNNRINFTEGNGKMDSEDVNSNYVLDRKNNYYTIKLDFGTNAFIEEKNENGWLKLSINLRYFQKIGSPELNIEKLDKIRFWFEGETKLEMQIAVIGIE